MDDDADGRRGQPGPSQPDPRPGETAGGPPERPLAVVGLMGAGKTTLARALAARLGRPLRDSDETVEERHGRSARDIADEDGQETLHGHERQVLLDALAEPSPVVVAAAASTLDTPSTVEALTRTPVVWLDTSPEVLADRFHSRSGRPVFGDVLEVLRDQDRRRRPTLNRVADVTLDATDPTERQVAVVVAALRLDGAQR